MTSGAKTTRRDWLLRGAALAALAGAAPLAQALELREVMGWLAARKSGEASFTEQRWVRGLDEPLSASGTLSFTAPDRFARETLSPRRETMVVEGNTVTLTRGGRSRSVNIDAVPELLVIVESIRGTLTGNTQTLQQHFETRVAGNAAAWTLDLVPRAAQAARLVRSVKLAGRRGDLVSVEMEMAGGDRSLMTIEPVRRAAPAASSS
jgi:outer membrane lipoprotein-sorting protein